MSMSHALKNVKSKHPITSTNSGFLSRLEDFEKSLLGVGGQGYDLHMADSSPFLSQAQPGDSEPAVPQLDQYLPSYSVDSIIEKCMGDKFSWVQFLQAIVVSLAWYFDAQQAFISVFADAEPTWHCKPQISNVRLINVNISCNSASNICQLPKELWAWDLPQQGSSVSEWALQCAGSFVMGLPASAFFVGCLLGGLILTTLADSLLGRKNMLLLSCLAMGFSTLFTAFSPNVWVYAALRFLGGCSRATIGTCALVLSTELVGKQWRGQVGVMSFIFFALGFLSLPAIAYLNRSSSWRNLYLWTSVPTIFYCMVIHYAVRESPRWLFVQGRTEDAIATLKCLSQTNHEILSMEYFSSMPLGKGKGKGKDASNVSPYSAIKVLVEKKWCFRRLLVVMTIGFGAGMVYYGMPLALGDLSFNLYLSVTFNALSELPSSLVTYYVVGKMNRKTSLLIFSIVSGIFSVMCVLKGPTSTWSRLQIGSEIVSFFGACTTVNILLIYTVELFPTCVRNSALSLVRQALVFGGVFSPLLAAAGRRNGVLSYGVFGVVIACLSLLVVCLPETRGRPLCDTIDEEENEKNLEDGTGRDV